MTIPPPPVLCVAEAVYHEARGVSLKDRILVAKLVWNRARDLKRSTCFVTHMKGQFPWAKRRFVIKENKAWEDSVTIAKQTRYCPTRVRYMTNTWDQSRYRHIHVLYKDKHLLFYNRYKDPLYKSESDCHSEHKHILPNCR